MRINQIRKTLFWIIALSCIFGLWYFQSIISVNIPWWDDFHGILLPVSSLFTDLPIAEKIQYFFSFNNEHRVINDRLFTLMVYLIRGTFDLKLLAILGFINLIGCFLLLFKVARPYVTNLLYLLPLVFLIFQAQYYESLQSLMVPFQNFSVIFYVLLSFYFLIYNSKYSFHFALFFAILSLFTHGNGLISFIIGFLLLLFQLKFRKTIIWSICSILIISIYFIGYSKPNWATNEGAISNPSNAVLYAFEFLGAYILNILDLSSQIIKSSLRKLIPAVYGLFLVSVFLFIIFKKYPIWQSNRKEYFNKLRHSKIDLFLLSGFAFFMATSILIGIGRNGFPMFSRYTINSAFFISFLYLLVLFNFKKNKFLVLIFSLGTFLILTISYFNNLDTAIYNRKNLVCDAINWQNNKTWMNMYEHPLQIQYINPLIMEPLNNGKYKFPNSTLNLLDFTKVGSYNISKAEIEDKYLHIVDYSLDNNLQNENGIYYALRSTKEFYIFPANQLSNNLAKYLSSGEYLNPEINTYYHIKNLPPNSYKLYRIEVLDQTKNILDTKKEFKIN